MKLKCMMGQHSFIVKFNTVARREERSCRLCPKKQHKNVNKWMNIKK